MICKLFRRILMLALCVCLFLCTLITASAAARPDEIQFTEEELAYIHSNSPLRVGYVQDRIPVSFSDEDGELAGISRYIFDRIAQLSGLTFEYVPLPAGSITYEYLLSEDLDFVTNVEYNSENLKARGILVSEPYLSSKKVVVVRENVEFDPNAELTVALSTGSQTLGKVISDRYPNFKQKNYDSIIDCFDALLAGEADLMIQNQYVVEYWFSKPAYEKLKIVPVPGLADELCFSAVFSFDGREGPSEDDGRILISILNKAIAAVTEEEIDSYTIQAVVENQYTYGILDFLSRYRYAVSIMFISVPVILILTVVLIRQRFRSLATQADAKAKGEFLSAMSHEIRTPLNGLIGLNQLISQRMDDREQVDRYLQQSTVTARYLLRLLNDVLDMSSLQNGTMEITPAPMDLSLLVSTTETLVQGTMTDQGLNFQEKVELSCPYVLGDEARVQQVLLNLLDNACKFTPEGGNVTLTVDQSATKDGSIVTRFKVSDTGCGIGEEFEKQVFHSFAQERETVSQGNQGTGLGLPLSRSLARLMGGDVTFTSKKGEGSDFFFTFSAQPVDAPEPVVSTPSSLKTDLPHILVAEDNELNREIMQDLLENEGFSVTLAEDGQEALEIFRDAPPNTFEVIIMDLLMPRMDGYQATEAIRDLPREDAKSVYIIACTANAAEQERGRILASGMDAFLSKPVDVDVLLEMISSRRS